MSAEFDVQSLLGLFLDESEVQLSTLERYILELSPRAQASDPSEAFRAAHALKGAARSMGFDEVGRLAHKLEDELERLRTCPFVPEDSVSLLLSALDALRSGLNNLTSPRSASQWFVVEIDPSCAMPGIRAELLLRALEGLGTIVDTRPERASLDHKLFSFAIESTASHEAIQACALTQPEIRSCRPEGAATADPDGPRKETTVRVPTFRLEYVANMVGEMVIERSRLGRCAHLMMLSRPDDPSVADLLDISDRVSHIVSELQHGTLSMRLMPIDGAFRRLQRLAHDVAAQLGKDVEITVSGNDTEVDRSVIETLADPLIHLLRNCIDHGIETPEVRAEKGKEPKGTISLKAIQEEGEVLIEIADDGAGIDPEKVRKVALNKGIIGEGSDLDSDGLIQLIFASGFSTASTLTDVSGRGVGMDIVKTNLEKVGGSIVVETALGLGTTFRIRLPISVSIMRCLLVQAGPSIVAIPEMLVHSTAVGPFGVDSLDLDALLNGQARTASTALYGVIVDVKGLAIAFGVDRLIAEEDLVVKPLSGWVVPADGVLGASILANGRVVLIVDPGRLATDVTPLPCSA